MRFVHTDTHACIPVFTDTHTHNTCLNETFNGCVSSLHPSITSCITISPLPNTSQIISEIDPEYFKEGEGECSVFELQVSTMPHVHTTDTLGGLDLSERWWPATAHVCKNSEILPTFRPAVLFIIISFPLMITRAPGRNVGRMSLLWYSWFSKNSCCCKLRKKIVNYTLYTQSMVLTSSIDNGILVEHSIHPQHLGPEVDTVTLEDRIFRLKTQDNAVSSQTHCTTESTDSTCVWWSRKGSIFRLNAAVE